MAFARKLYGVEHRRPQVSHPNLLDAMRRKNLTCGVNRHPLFGPEIPDDYKDYVMSAAVNIGLPSPLTKPQVRKLLWVGNNNVLREAINVYKFREADVVAIDFEYHIEDTYDGNC